MYVDLKIVKYDVTTTVEYEFKTTCTFCIVLCFNNEYILLYGKNK